MNTDSEDQNYRPSFQHLVRYFEKRHASATIKHATMRLVLLISRIPWASWKEYILFAKRNQKTRMEAKRFSYPPPPTP